MADKKISALTGASTPLAGTEVLPVVQSGATVKVSVANLTAGRAVETGTLTPTGNVRVGFTTDANWTGTQAVLLGKSGASNPTYPYVASTDSQTLQSGSNAYWDGTNWKYQFSAFIPASRHRAGYNGFYWDIGDGGTAGNNITWKTILSATDSYNITFGLGNLIQGTAAKGINFTANTPAAGMTSQLLNWYEEGTWTPVVEAFSGTITSYTSSAKYTRIGRVVHITGTFTITNNGTGAGAVILKGMPFNAPVTNQDTGVFRDITNGPMGQMVFNNTNTLLLAKYDNSYPGGTNYTFAFSMTYFV